MAAPSSEPPVTFEPSVTSIPARKLHWPVFLVALLLPPVLTMLAVMSDRPGDAPALIAMGGSPVAGLVCGWLLARRVTQTTTGLVLATLGFTVLFGAVIFSLCFAGCFAAASAKGQI